jgi:uncharacterized protein (TIGR03437 family)
MKLSQLLLPIAAVCGACFAQTLPSFTLTNVIGSGTAGYAGDDAAAKDAQLNFPMSIARASNGTLYIADTFNQRIRTVQTDGVIRTAVGTGVFGFSGDGAAATAALISSPYGVALDTSGNLYFSDSRNNMIRKVGSNGTISRLAGTGVNGFGGDGGNALDAWMALPTALVVDPSGNVIFSDTLNNRVRKITPDGKIFGVAGTGQPNSNGDGHPATDAAVYAPEGLALDSAGNLYIAETFGHKIRKVAPDGTISTVAGTGLPGFQGDGGAAVQAQLNYPRGVYVDASGAVYIADTLNNRIRVVTENQVIRTIAGTGRFGDAPDNIPALYADLRNPRAIVPNGSGGFYLLDTDNSRIRMLTPVPQPPAINKGGIVSSSAFGGFSKAARGTWLEIYGANLAQGRREWTSSDFVDGKAPTALSGTRVTIGGQPTFVSYVSPGQVNVQVPDTLAAGTHDVILTTPEGSSVAYKLTVEDVQPGLFAPASLTANGKQYAGVMLADGTLATAGSRRAKPGDTVTLYGIGFGSVAPDPAPGEIVRSANSVVMPLQVFFGDVQANVTYAGLAPGALGLYQINVVVPAIPTNDAVPLTFKLNGAAGQQALYTAIGN